jgi:hypothetical protein
MINIRCCYLFTQNFQQNFFPTNLYGLAPGIFFFKYYQGQNKLSSQLSAIKKRNTFK